MTEEQRRQYLDSSSIKVAEAVVSVAEFEGEEEQARSAQTWTAYLHELDIAIQVPSSMQMEREQHLGEQISVLKELPQEAMQQKVEAAEQHISSLAADLLAAKFEQQNKESDNPFLRARLRRENTSSGSLGGSSGDGDSETQLLHELRPALDAHIKKNQEHIEKSEKQGERMIEILHDMKEGTAQLNHNLSQLTASITTVVAALTSSRNSSQPLPP